MTSPEPLFPAALNPYDLTVPAQLLYPGTMHKRTGWQKAEVKLGSGEDAATLTVTSWTGCEVRCPGRGDHGKGSAIWLSVPCDNLPHCHSCECGDSHVFPISVQQVAGLLAALRPVLP